MVAQRCGVCSDGDSWTNVISGQLRWMKYWSWIDIEPLDSLSSAPETISGDVIHENKELTETWVSLMRPLSFFHPKWQHGTSELFAPEQPPPIVQFALVTCFLWTFERFSHVTEKFTLQPKLSPFTKKNFLPTINANYRSRLFVKNQISERSRDSCGEICLCLGEGLLRIRLWKSISHSNAIFAWSFVEIS